ncbi:MAG: hypothetical protein Q9200_004664 [Gallowayella weberi]
MSNLREIDTALKEREVAVKTREMMAAALEQILFEREQALRAREKDFESATRALVIQTDAILAQYGLKNRVIDKQQLSTDLKSLEDLDHSSTEHTAARENRPQKYHIQSQGQEHEPEEHTEKAVGDQNSPVNGASQFEEHSGSSNTVTEQPIQTLSRLDSAIMPTTDALTSISVGAKRISMTPSATDDSDQETRRKRAKVDTSSTVLESQQSQGPSKDVDQPFTSTNLPQPQQPKRKPLLAPLPKPAQPPLKAAEAADPSRTRLYLPPDAQALWNRLELHPTVGALERQQLAALFKYWAGRTAEPWQMLSKFVERSAQDKKLCFTSFLRSERQSINCSGNHNHACQECVKAKLTCFCMVGLPVDGSVGTGGVGSMRWGVMMRLRWR